VNVLSNGKLNSEETRESVLEPRRSRDTDKDLRTIMNGELKDSFGILRHNKNYEILCKGCQYWD